MFYPSNHHILIDNKIHIRRCCFPGFFQKLDRSIFEQTRIPPYTTHQNWLLGFLGGSDGKETAWNARTPSFNPQVEKIPWKRKWWPTNILAPGTPMNRGAWWATYSSWDPKELDMTEQICFFFFFFLSLILISREQPPKNSILHLSPAIERGTF